MQAADLIEHGESVRRSVTLTPRHLVTRWGAIKFERLTSTERHSMDTGKDFFSSQGFGHLGSLRESCR
jgi:hypothetical protein